MVDIGNISSTPNNTVLTTQLPPPAVDYNGHQISLATSPPSLQDLLNQPSPDSTEDSEHQWKLEPSPNLEELLAKKEIRL